MFEQFKQITRVLFIRFMEIFPHLKKLAVLLIIWPAVQSLTSCSTTRNNLLLENPLNQSRTDELITLERAFIQNKVGISRAGQTLQIISRGNPLPMQLSDLDKDGFWDHAYLILSFSPMEKKSLSISTTSKSPESPEKRAHVRHKRKNADDSFGPLLLKDSIPAGQINTDFTKSPLPPFLTEGPSWENDKVGFRLYFDQRNGKDIWGKTTTAMVLDTVGMKPGSSYHEKASWGMDVLKVGASLGSGSLALSVPWQGKDTLVRLGGINMGKVIFECFADGPLIGILRFTYPEWKVLPGLPPVGLTEEIKIWAGQFFFHSTVSVQNAPAGSSLVTGIVNLKSSKAEFLAEGNAKILYTYGKQSENNDELGMAIMLNKSDYLSHSVTSNTSGDIRNTHIVHLPVRNSPSFKFFAGWVKSDPRFIDSESFKTYLKTKAVEDAHPILIR